LVGAEGLSPLDIEIVLSLTDPEPMGLARSGLFGETLGPGPVYPNY
jgi:hypothetical protein